MGAYEFQVLFGAVNYVFMYPSFIIMPELWAMLLFNIDKDSFTDEIVKSIEGVFFLIMTIVAPNYFIAIFFKYSNFAAVTVLQRIVLIACAAIWTGLLGQDPFKNKNFIALMFLVDVGSGFAHGSSHPNGLSGVIQDVWTLTKNTPTNSFNKSLRVESYVGITFGFMACVYAAVVAQIKLGIIITTMATVIVYVWIGFHANDPSETPTKCLLVQRMIIAGSLLFLSDVKDYEELNIIFRLMSVALVVGIISPYLGALIAGVSTLVLYKLGCDYVLSTESKSVTWMCLWGVVTIITSYGWIYLFYDEYDEKQKKRLLNTNWQDKILGVFCFISGAALDKAGFLSPGTVGEPVVYLLPPVTLWFTLETKMLNHLQVGTPFHPTWWVDGDLPRFSPTDWVNVTFGIATALITVVLTTYAFYAVNSAVGFDSLSFATETTWKFTLAHGILFIWHSGMWMIVASSGVPPIASHTKPFSVFPPELPAFVQANPHDCIPVHKSDLAIGVVLLFVGTFLLGAEDDLSLLIKVCVGSSWVVQVVKKILVHKKGQGYVPPINQKND